MPTPNQTENTPGQRAALAIMDELHLPMFKQTTQALADIIDRETAAPELLTALKDCAKYLMTGHGNRSDIWNRANSLLGRFPARSAIARTETKQ